METCTSIMLSPQQPLNITQIIGIVQTIYKFNKDPKEDQMKQIECISALQNFLTPDEDGDIVVAKIFHREKGCIETLLKFISVCYYPHVVLRSFTLIYKCVSQKRSAKGILARTINTSYIFDEGQFLINIFLNLEDKLEFVGCTTEILNSINFYLISILDIACKRDKNFCRHFNRSQVTQKLMRLLGQYKKCFKISVALLDIFRWLIKTQNVNNFVTNKLFFENLDCIFTVIKNKKSQKMKSIILLLKTLIKNVEFVHESIFETKLIYHLLTILVNDDNLPVSYSMYRAIVYSIYKIIKKDAFLDSFKNNANIHLLHRFCSNFVVADEKHQIVLLRAISVIYACLAKRTLPTNITKCYIFTYATKDLGDTQNENNGECASIISDDSDDEDEEDDDLCDEETEDQQEYNASSDYEDHAKTNNIQKNRDSQLCKNVVTNPQSFASLYTYNFCKELSTSAYNGIYTFENIDKNTKPYLVYCQLASRVKTTRKFIKVAYPDMISAESVQEPHYLINNYYNCSRSKLLALIDKAVNERTDSSYELVFDLDLLQKNGPINSLDNLRCDDLNNIKSSDPNFSSLQFESRFEGGNLRKAYKVSSHVYNLILAPDVNTNCKYQWFYFEVSNTKAHASYVFNIINCDKSTTQYNHGMQPVFFSVKDASMGKIGWIRTGSDIFYYRNNYHDLLNPSAIYHTLSFTIRFPYNNDVCYIAYHYPYTYTRLMTFLYNLQLCPRDDIYCTVDTLCLTLNGNPIPLVTITAPKSDENPINNRKIVVLTSRVHPGESNASWVIEGTLKYLLLNDVKPRQLRENYVFKIVPMQNPEGVIYGSYRCGLTVEDLNRCWRNPDSFRHPEVIHIKAMIQQLISEYKRPVSLYLDYHGHSRKRNFFLYGCSNKASWKKNDRRHSDNLEEYLHYPTVLANNCKSMSFKSCKFNVEKNRESTARVAIWREFGIKCSYTVECSYCGFDIGPYKAQAINTTQLFEIGASLMEALWIIASEVKSAKQELNKENIVLSNDLDKNNDVTYNN